MSLLFFFLYISVSTCAISSEIFSTIWRWNFDEKKKFASLELIKNKKSSSTKKFVFYMTKITVRKILPIMKIAFNVITLLYFPFLLFSSLFFSPNIYFLLHSQISDFFTSVSTSWLPDRRPGSFNISACRRDDNIATGAALKREWNVKE